MKIKPRGWSGLSLVYVWYSEETNMRRFCWHQSIPHQWKISSLDYNTNKKVLVIFILKRTRFLEFNFFIHLSIFGSPHNQGSTYIIISTLPEDQNPHIWELLFLPFVSSILNEYLLWYLLVLEILVFFWGCLSFHFLIYNINLTYFPTLTYYNLLLFATACFTRMYLVRIWIRFGGASCCSTCSGSLIHKKPFLEKA